MIPLLEISDIRATTLFIAQKREKEPGIRTKLARDAHLSSHITELSSYAEEELVLLVHRLVLVSCKPSRLFGLKLHIRIRNFRYGREKEDDGEQEDEGGDTEVGPLHLGDVVWVCFGEEDARGQQGSHCNALAPMNKSGVM